MVLASTRWRRKPTSWPCTSSTAWAWANPQGISALHGYGVGDLLDEVVAGFPAHERRDALRLPGGHPRPAQRGQVLAAEHPDRPAGRPGQRDLRHHPRLGPHRPEVARQDHPPDRHRGPAPQVQGQGSRRGLQQHAHHPRPGAVRRGRLHGRRRRGLASPRTPRSPA